MSEDLTKVAETPVPQEFQALVSLYEKSTDDQWMAWSLEWGVDTTRLIRNTAVAMIALGEEGRKKRRAEDIASYQSSQQAGGITAQAALISPLSFISEAALKRIEASLNKIVT